MPVLPQSVGFCRCRPRLCLAENRVVGLRFHGHAVEFVAAFDQDGPTLLEDAIGGKALEPAVDGGVRTERQGHPIPLYTGVEAVDDVFEDGSNVDAVPPSARGRIVLVEEVGGDGPESDGDLPDGLGRWNLADRAGHERPPDRGQ